MTRTEAIEFLLTYVALFVAHCRLWLAGCLLLVSMWVAGEEIN